jgi:hypothetical protein
LFASIQSFRKDPQSTLKIVNKISLHNNQAQGGYQSIHHKLLHQLKDPSFSALNSVCGSTLLHYNGMSEREETTDK